MAVSTRAFSSNNPFRHPVKSQDFDIELYNTDRSSFLYSHPTTSDQSLNQAARKSFYGAVGAAASSSATSLEKRHPSNPFLNSSERQASAAPRPRHDPRRAAPPTNRTRSRRSNSDSSLVEAAASLYRKESSRREAARKDVPAREPREPRDKEHKSKSKRSSKKKAPPLDTIDKLDVTGLFGPGSFHHDGPFDACNPHRNKRDNRKAPMMAFPADGANMKVSGADTTRAQYATESRIFGREEVVNGEGARLAAALANNPSQTSLQPNFDPASNARPVHGDTTIGLGSSTFLDGAPAPRSAIDRSAQEHAASSLGRKRSIVQKLRGTQAPAVDRRARESLLASTATDIARSKSSDQATPRTTAFAAEQRKTSDTSVSSSNASPPPSSGLLRRVRSLKVGSKKRD